MILINLQMINKWKSRFSKVQNTKRSLWHYKIHCSDLLLQENTQFEDSCSRWCRQGSSDHASKEIPSKRTNIHIYNTPKILDSRARNAVDEELNKAKLIRGIFQVTNRGLCNSLSSWTLLVYVSGELKFCNPNLHNSGRSDRIRFTTKK